MNRNISMQQSKLLLIGIFAVAVFLSLVANNVSAQTYTDLHSFNCATEGCYPQYPAILAQAETATYMAPVGGEGLHNTEPCSE